MTPLDYALRYAERGLRVLPIRERAKEPLVEHGVHDASSDKARIREWWKRWPTANVAIAVPESWSVVDVDPRNGGDREIERLQRKHVALPATITARTGSGGVHMLFARPAGLRLRGKLAPGVDFLSSGRYFLVAPSIHPCGGRYQWTSQRGTEIAHAPKWLLDLATPPPDPDPAPSKHIELRSRPTAPDVIERARRYLAATPPAISGSGGHTHTFLVAQKLVRGFGLDEGTGFVLLSEWNQTCQPPWSPRELARKLKEAARSGQMPIGGLLEAAVRRAS